MNSILNSPDILVALQQRKLATEQKLKTSRTRIQEMGKQLWSPMPKATSRAERVSQLVSNGVMIYNGVRIFASIISSVRSLFGPKRRRRR